VKRSTPLRRSWIRRKPKEPDEAAACFRQQVLARAAGSCERCGVLEYLPSQPWTKLEAHHLVSRARGVGWELLHDSEANGAALCVRCHDQVHRGRICPDRDRWVRSRPLQP